jgi:hypothetical protein
MIVPKKVLSIIKKNVDINYSPITKEEKNKLQLLCDSINKEFNIKMTLSQIILFRNSIVYLLSKKVGTYVLKKGEDIMKRYNNKESIIDIANKYNVPPMSIVYQILMENKNESHKIQHIIKHTSLLPEDIQVQMKTIEKHDPIFWYNVTCPTIKIDKSKFPYIIRHKTKKIKHPSLLFKNPFSYKGITINWIEFKNFSFLEHKLFIHDIKKTLFNFNKFGHGLILYLDIICTKTFMKKIDVNIDTYASFCKCY